MGLDLTAIPVSLDSPPIRTIRTDARAWHTAIAHAPFTSLPSAVLPEISRQLLDSFPTGLNRTSTFPDRSYEQAEFLLDPVAYRSLSSWEQRERSLPLRIIQGDGYFAEHATATQGVPWRCSTAGFLARAAATIDAFDPATARREFSVAEMAAHGVYKVSGAEDDDAAFHRILGGLRHLARYYHRLADSGLDLILVRD